MKLRLSILAVLLALGASGLRAEEATTPEVKIKPKVSSSSSSSSSSAARSARTARDGGVRPDTDVIDAPTTAVLDNYGYSSRSRFYSRGGLLENLAFGVYPGINLGASAAIDGLIGDERHVRLRAPTAQVKYRFYEGDSDMPSFAVGFDGQGYSYNAGSRRFNQRQRGFYVVAATASGLKTR